MSGVVGKKIMLHLLRVFSVSGWIKLYQIACFPQMSWESCWDRDLLRKSEWWGRVVAGEGCLLLLWVVEGKLLKVSCWEWVVHGVLLRESCFWKVVGEREREIGGCCYLTQATSLKCAPQKSKYPEHALSILSTYCQQALNMFQLAPRRALNRPSCYSQHALITASTSSRYVFPISAIIPTVFVNIMKKVFFSEKCM